MQPEREPIRFRPVNKGLGFHPFSEGLPYTPTAPNVPLRKPAAPAQQPLRDSTKREPTKTQTPVSKPTEPLRLGWGYVASRVIAFLVDTVLHSSVCALALGLTIWKWLPSNGGIRHAFASHELIALSVLFLLGFSWALTTAQEIAFGTSIGKRMMGLRLEGSVTAIFLRGFFFWISVCFFGLGILSAIFSKRRRCWHDAVVDIQPL